MLTEIGGRVSEFWNRLQDFEHRPLNYFLMSNMIHHNINFVILLASVCYWLLREERRIFDLMPHGFRPLRKPPAGSGRVGRAAVLLGFGPVGHAVIAHAVRSALSPPPDPAPTHPPPPPPPLHS